MDSQNFNHTVEPEKPVSTKLFFNLHIYSINDVGQSQYLAFQQNGVQQYLASRVIKGDTLSQAITFELQQSLQINKWEFADSTSYADKAFDNQGNEIERFDVFIKVPYFDTADRRVLSMEMQWIPATQSSDEPDVTNEDDDSSEKRVVAANATLNSALIAALKAGEKKPVVELWRAFTLWLSKASPEQHALLNPPASETDFEKFKQVMGYDLPENIKQLYRINDGGVNTNESFNLILGWLFLSIEDILSNAWQSPEEPGEAGDYPPSSAIKHLRESPKWVPIASDGGGNYLSVDLDPAQEGVIGQIIVCGRDEYLRKVEANSIEDHLANLLLQFSDNNVAIDLDEGYSWYLTND